MKRTVWLMAVIGVVLLLPLVAAAQAEDTGRPAELVAASVEAASPDSPSATFVVNSTAEPGSGVCDAAECTLREALIQANSTTALDTISFNIPGAGPHVITLKAALQPVNQALLLDGFTQPGTSCDTFPTALKIVINGSGLAGGETGLTLNAPNSIVRGVVVQRFPSHGVVVQAGGNSLYCNYVGTNSDGSIDLGNGGIGVYVNNGGNNSIYANLISGNGSFGVYVGGASASGNRLYTNRIGTNLAGTSALANDAEGIMLVNAANTTIGGIGGNVVSGNKGYGISVGGSSAGTVITKNYVGTQLTGNSALPNTSTGVYIGTANITVGGPSAADRNVISGNQGSGIVLAANNVKVLNNYIGVSRLAEAKIPNTSYGIYVKSSGNQVGQPGQGNVIGGNGQDGIFIESGQNNLVQDNYIGTDSSLGLDLGNAYFGIHVSGGTNSTIGGTAGNTDNHIARNGADGVYVPSPSSQGIRILGNSIFQNGGLGIDLGEDRGDDQRPGRRRRRAERAAKLPRAGIGRDERHGDAPRRHAEQQGRQELPPGVLPCRRV